MLPDASTNDIDALVNGSTQFALDLYDAVNDNDGNELSMVILVPDAGQFVSFEASLTADKIDSIIAGMSGTNTRLKMPKFEYSAKLSLAQTLAAMGMPVAFSTEANLSGMDGTRNLQISDVFHKAFVAGDEYTIKKPLKVAQASSLCFCFARPVAGKNRHAVADLWGRVFARAYKFSHRQGCLCYLRNRRRRFMERALRATPARTH